MDVRFAKQLEYLHRSISREVPSRDNESKTRNPRDEWDRADTEALNLLNWNCAPAVYKFELSDWKSLSFINRLMMTGIATMISISGGAILDDFDDEDTCARLEKRRNRWKEHIVHIDQQFRLGAANSSIELWKLIEF